MANRAIRVAIIFAIVASACGGTDDEASSPAPTAESLVDGTAIGPDGGSVTSDDGMFTVDVPAGALPTSVNVDISVVSPSDLGLDPDVLAGPIYQLSPDGTVFDVPVTTIRTLSASDLGVEGGNVPFVHVFQGDGDAWIPLSTETSRQGDAVQIRAQTSHFSPNAAVATTEVWGYGIDLTLELTPGSFTAPVTTSVETDWTLLRPERLIVSADTAAPSFTGALASFVLEEDFWFAGTATCGESSGAGTYTVALEGTAEPEDRDGPEQTGADAFYLVFFGAVPSPEPYTIAVTGNATCTAGDADTSEQGEQPADQDVASLFAGSFGGSLSLESLLDDAAFESPYLLSILSPESADVVFPEDAKLTAKEIADIITRAVGDPLPPLIILSQIQPNDVGQNTYGAAADIGGGTIRIFTASSEETYSEFYLFDITFCSGFPARCQDIMASFVTVGGEPGLDIDSAIAAMEEHLEQDISEFLGYEWAFEGNGTLTRESGTPGG